MSKYTSPPSLLLRRLWGRRCDKTSGLHSKLHGRLAISSLSVERNGRRLPRLCRLQVDQVSLNPQTLSTDDKRAVKRSSFALLVGTWRRYCFPCRRERPCNIADSQLLQTITVVLDRVGICDAISRWELESEPIPSLASIAVEEDEKLLARLTT